MSRSASQMSAEAAEDEELKHYMPDEDINEMEARLEEALSHRQELESGGSGMEPSVSRAALALGHVKAHLRGALGQVKAYMRRLKGHKDGPVLQSSLWECFISFVGACIGIWVVAAIHWEGLIRNGATVKLGSQRHQLLFIIASYGASAALLFGGPLLPVSQPFNVIGGHTVSALVGVGFYFAFRGRDAISVGAALSVATAIAAMQILRVFHPPAAATALIATMGLEGVADLGVFWVIMPVAAGATVLCFVALLYNNLFHHRRPWPIFWHCF